MRITWFGHSAFAIEANGKKVLVDPFLSGNPTFEAAGEATARKSFADVQQGLTHLVLTHGHSDHVGDTLTIARNAKPVIFCNYELGVWLGSKAAAANDGKDAGLSVEVMNTGGTVENNGVSVTLVRADHSSGEMDNGVMNTLGLPNGAIIRLPDSPVVWHMGDTDIFSDMALINELHKPEIVIMPIGDRFTMGPRAAAYAVRKFLSNAKVIIPAHWGTFPLLTGTPEAFRTALGEQAKMVAELKPHEAKEF